MSVTASLIISTYNRPETLYLTLLSVSRQSLFPNEIIIADDGSSDETKLLIETFKKKLPIPIVHVWHEDKGFRLASIRNKAIAVSKYDYIISIDGDVILHKYFIKDHIKHASKGFFVTGSRVLLGKQFSDSITKKKQLPRIHIFIGDTKNRVNGIRIPWLNYNQIITDNITNKCGLRGCNMAFWRNDLIKVNGFDEIYEGWGGEDKDVSARLLKSGVKRHRIKFALIVYHIFHKKASRSKRSKNILLVQSAIDEKRIKAVKGII